MIHMYCGEGKGKTTAAMGLALRALGHGREVVIVQFLKGRPSGEITMLEKLPGVTIFRGKPGTKFTSRMNEEERRQAMLIHMENFEQATAQSCDLLVLDEALGAVEAGFFPMQVLLQYLQDHREQIEIVLTGRPMNAEIAKQADYITYMQKKRHPYDKGVNAREGIEF